MDTKIGTIFAILNAKDAEMQFFSKKNTLFFKNEKRLHSAFLILHRQTKGSRFTTFGFHKIDSLAQLDQSTTLRTSGSGVRISHEPQTWSFGRHGVCAGLKILRTWFDSTRFHPHIAS